MKAENYTLSNLLSGVKMPRRALLELNKLYQTRIKSNTGIDIIQKNWDNLIILDGCRYDTFEKLNIIPGTLKKVNSAGSITPQFLEENFPSDEYPEVVYVSANPNVRSLDTKFHKRIRLWEEYTDNECGVVLPETVTAESLKAYEKFSNKRLIIHYMQPHFPFIGEFGRSLYENNIIEHRQEGVHFWEQISEGDVSKDQFRRAYKENLSCALSEVKKLTQHMSGRTVVTSDHGNEFGKFGIYGHPYGVYTSGLIQVPWLIVDADDERDTIPGNAKDGPIEESEQLNKKLEMLGYK